VIRVGAPRERRFSYSSIKLNTNPKDDVLLASFTYCSVAT